MFFNFFFFQLVVITSLIFITACSKKIAIFQKTQQAEFMRTMMLCDLSIQPKDSIEQDEGAVFIRLIAILDVACCRTKINFWNYIVQLLYSHEAVALEIGDFCLSTWDCPTQDLFLKFGFIGDVQWLSLMCYEAWTPCL